MNSILICSNLGSALQSFYRLSQSVCHGQTLQLSLMFASKEPTRVEHLRILAMAKVKKNTITVTYLRSPALPAKIRRGRKCIQVSNALAYRHKNFKALAIGPARQASKIAAPHKKKFSLMILRTVMTLMNERKQTLSRTFSFYLPFSRALFTSLNEMRKTL